MIYVAVVLTSDRTSKRPEHDHACFVGTDKDETISKALKAARKWGSTAFTSYHVEVGTLTERASTRVEYTLEDLGGK